MHFVVATTARARVLVTGVDGPSFLHRMSTQHTATLGTGEARLNVLTNDKGRIVDVVHHVVVDEGVLLVGTNLDGASLVAWLDRYFFTEKLALQELAQSACVVVDGATASSFVDGAAALAPWGARRAGPLVAVRTFDVADGDGAVVPAFVLVSLDATTAPLPAASTSTEDFACAAIAAGVPTREIGDAHTPLDLALHDAIHWAKGCYIGQEVIARLDTYGKQKKHLTGVVVDAGAVAVGDVVVVDGSAVGALTSVAPRPWCASLPSALALVKGVDEGDGLAAHVKRSDGTLVDVRLVPRRAAQRPHD